MDRQDDARDQNARTISELNDRLRTTGVGGRTVLTRAVANLPPERLVQLLRAVRAFAQFTSANDPWRERDFGSVELDEQRFFWKIDCYDVNLEYGSPDPADESLTCRVMTIMHEHEL